MNDEERLNYHKANSTKPMEEIRAYAIQKLENKEIEPNSTLGQAFKYILNNWEGLTKFLREPGVPLDNNSAERLLKKAILHRKNSLFYKTLKGAEVGDVLMSIIQTCIAANQDPFHYLTEIGRNAKHVEKYPEMWFPWNYINTLKSLGKFEKVESKAQSPP